MKSRLYVGNLAYSVTKQELDDEFARFGPLKECRLMVEADGRSKGFAFVEFEKIEDAENAVESLDGREIRGRKIKIREANERRPKPN